MSDIKKTCVTQGDIDKLLQEAEVGVATVHDKCTLVSVKLKNGFVITDSFACVDPENYSVEAGFDVCMDRIATKLWELEGYALQKKLHEEANA
jgi:hypothetical protein